MSDNAQAGQAEPPRRRRLPPILLLVIVMVVVVGIIIGVVWWLNARRFESTDDAFIDTHIVRLAPQIAGRVTSVAVVDNQRVRAGQPVLTIDSADAEARLAQGRASVAQAEAQARTARAQAVAGEAGYRQALAQQEAARAQANNAARDFARYETLQRINTAALAQQQFDQARSAAEQGAAQLAAAVRAAAGKAQDVTAGKAQAAAAAAQVKAAKAQLSQNQIALGYSRIVAPTAGTIASMSVAVGNYVQPGTEVMAIVPLDVWVTANFKETQLAHMRVGQRVEVKVDACPSDHVVGHVDSIQRGAGQAFSLLPAQNATGNYIKVLQRVPVKIALDHPPADCPLGPGMSVEPRVQVR